MRKIQVCMCAMMVAVSMTGCGLGIFMSAPEREKEPAPQTQEVQQETNVAQEETTEAATEETTTDYVVLEDGTYSTNFVTENEDEPLLDAIAAYAERNGITQDILIEVNIGREAQKGGVTPEALDALLDRIAGLGNVRLRGLMCVPPAIEQEAVRPYFREMRGLFERIQRMYSALPIDTLSMGMSHDFTTAIEEGATTVRVGTAIFGPRTFSGGKQNG